MGSSSTKAKNKYNANNYDSLRVTVPKGKKETLQAHCRQYGYSSLNRFVNDAIDDKVRKDTKE